jgi:hypothetical protein
MKKRNATHACAAVLAATLLGTTACREMPTHTTLADQQRVDTRDDAAATVGAALPEASSASTVCDVLQQHLAELTVQQAARPDDSATADATETLRSMVSLTCE